jgi:hypothetical protein
MRFVERIVSPDIGKALQVFEETPRNIPLGIEVNNSPETSF